MVITLWFPMCAESAAGTGEHGHFFLFAAPGTATPEASAAITGVRTPANTTLVHVGGGGEATLTRVWGIGTDFGGLTPTRGAGTIASISVSAFVHPLPHDRLRLDPYLTLGYNWFVRDATRQRLGAASAGGGLNYWITPPAQSRLGVKVEFRDYMRPGQDRLRFSEVRVGVCLSQ